MSEMTFQTVYDCIGRDFSIQRRHFDSLGAFAFARGVATGARSRQESSKVASHIARSQPTQTTEHDQDQTIHISILKFQQLLSTAVASEKNRDFSR